MNNKNDGFTLLELLVTLAIVAIIAALAAPSFNNIVERTRAEADRDELFQGLRYARSEAVKRAVAVSICPADIESSVTCGSGGWDDGWVIFLDSDRNGAIEDQDVDVLKVYSARSRLSSFSVDATATNIEFVPNGQANIGDTSITARFCYFDDRQSADITLSPVGRVSSERGGAC